MTFQDQDARTPQTDKNPHAGLIPVDQGGERPVVELDRSLKDAVAEGYIDEQNPLGDVVGVTETGHLAVETQHQSRAEAKAAIPERKSHKLRNGVIAGLAGAAVIASGFGVKGFLFPDKPDNANPAVPVEPANPNEGENPEVTATEQLAQTIADRPEAGSAEYETLVEKYENHADTPDQVIMNYGHNMYGIITASFAEIPSGYFLEHIEMTLDEATESTHPEYWGEVYSNANFGKPSAELSGDQLVLYEAFMTDLRVAISNRLLTSDSESPTNFDDLSGDSASVESASDTRVVGTYSVVVQPNKNNVISEQNPEISGPTQIDIAGIYERSTPDDPWYWIGIP